MATEYHGFRSSAHGGLTTPVATTRRPAGACQNISQFCRSSYYPTVEQRFSLLNHYLALIRDATVRERTILNLLAAS